MPRCDATFDGNAPPLGQGGTSGGFERGNSPTPRCAPPLRRRDFHGTRRQNAG